MPAPSGQQCSNCQFFVSYQNGPGQCHEAVPPWTTCRDDDWCGEWRRSGAKLSDQYLHGALDLQDTTVKTLLALAVGAVTDSVVMKACQLLNTSTNDTVVIEFLDGTDPVDILGFVSCGPKTSKEIAFEPGLMASVGNNICVKLDQSITPGHMYVTAQGFMLGQVSAIVEVGEVPP